MKRLFLIKCLFISAVLSALLLLGSTQAHAAESGSCGSGVTYTLDNSGKLTISGSGAITSHPWTSSTVKTVVINNGVTSIGASAFNSCSNLTSITIPNSVTSIGGSAFDNCSSLTSITIPNSVTSIGYSAFIGCRNLTSITIPNSVTSIGSSAFYGCNSLTSITIPFVGATKDGAGEKYLGYIFGAPSFYSPEYIPASLKKVVVTGGNSIDGYAFFHCSGITSITIPDSVTSIGGLAFSGCSGITSITIPDSVTRIDGYAFIGCSGITSITIPDSVTSIGGLAFSGCSGITSITIPDSVTEIGQNAFAGTKWYSDKSDGLIYAGKVAYKYKGTCPPSISIVNGTKSIADYAFEDCRSLTSIAIPNSVTSIGQGAFSDCSGLTSITIPGSVTRIDGYAFEGCSGLKSIVFEGDAPIISGHCFLSVTTTVKYPCNKSSWDTVKGNKYAYGGNLTWEAINHVPAASVEERRINPTLSRDGSYDSVVYCSGCHKELSRKTISIPKLVANIAKFSDGKWYYTVNGKKDLTFTGFASNANGRFRVEKGVVNFKYSDIVKDENEWRYYSGGKWQTGVASVEKRSNGTWWYVKKGVVQFGTNSVVKRTENNTWWYVKGGQVQFGFTGFASNANGRFRIVKGQVNFKYTDIVKDGNEWRYYSGGKWQTGVVSVEKRSNGTWWYVEEGVVQFGVTNVVRRIENNTLWYVKNGQVQTKLTSVVETPYGYTWYVKNGQVQTTVTGVVKRTDNNTWWYVENGRVQYNFTGIAKKVGDSSRWYVKNGQVQTDFSGTIKINNYYSEEWYKISKGRVK